MTTKIRPLDGKLSNAKLAGLDNTKISEKQPRYAISESEKEIKGLNNARIILGRDRNHNITSGYGGLGHTRCGAVDIVVGLQGWAPAEGGEITDGIWRGSAADKNFGSMNVDKPGDAARIYISQRANIDEYFDICEGGVGQSVAESAIGMKADSVRIMARKGIKLVTGKNPPGRNSMGGKIRTVYGIDLIAGNRDEDTGLKLPTEGQRLPILQPIPKGDNLADALEQMMKQIEGLNNLVSSLLMNLQRLTNVVMEPRIGGNAGGPVTAQLTAGMSTCIKIMNDIQRYSFDLNTQRKSMNTFKIDYLNIGGARYINSLHNRTN